MQNQEIVIYGTTVDSVSSVIGSGVLQGCNIVGVCTDELVLGESTIMNIPIVQIDNINCPIVLLDENIPDTYRKIIKEKEISMWKLDYFLNMINSATELDDKTDVDRLSEENVEIVSDDSITSLNSLGQENFEISQQKTSYFSNEQAEEIRNTLILRLEKIYQAVNNTKNKDMSIYNINKELQKFKDGYYERITSPIISEMIVLREDYKKSIEDCSKFSLTYEKQARYLECTIDQIDEILAIYGVEVKDEKYLYNGKVIHPTTNSEPIEPTHFKSDYIEIAKITNCFTEDATEVNDCASLEQFLIKEISNVETLLQNNEALIRCIEIQNSDLKKQTAITDGLVIVPLLRKIIKMKLEFLNKRNMLESYREESERIYKEAYEYGIKYSEKILLSLGVRVRSCTDDVYDPKYHRILKMQKIMPEECEKEKHIAMFITDCYVSEERVVAPAKVIVYKL